jgi:hypothetical protein
VTEALRNLFKANGFNVVRYFGKSEFSSLPDERLVVKGQIIRFWLNGHALNGYAGSRGKPPIIEATIDIDLAVIDTQHQRTVRVI